MDRDSVSSTENLWSENRERTRVYDVLVDFQTGGNFPVLVRYIYKFCKLNVMVHRCKHLCFTSQLWLPYLAFCFDLTECFWGLCIWSGFLGSKSGSLHFVLQIVTVPPS